MAVMAMLQATVSAAVYWQANLNVLCWHGHQAAVCYCLRLSADTVNGCIVHVPHVACGKLVMCARRATASVVGLHNACCAWFSLAFQLQHDHDLSAASAAKDCYAAWSVRQRVLTNNRAARALICRC